MFDADPHAPNVAEELTREVYARFGLAYYMTECIFRGLVNLFAILPFTRASATRPRVEERMKVAEQMTLGEVVRNTKPLLSADLHGSLEWALAKRNILAHGFWFERVHMMATDDGKQELIDELMQDVEVLRGLSGVLDTLNLEHMRRLGMTQEQFAEALAASREPVEPLPARRIPKMEETIEVTAAWMIEREQGLSTLVMRDSAGLMWQLCDVGLGWSNFIGPDETWKPVSKLMKLLPARVVARPKSAKPWNYNLHVSTGALISVSRGEEGPFTLRIEMLNRG
jgi:hypothetical protein